MNDGQNDVSVPANNARDAWRRLTLEPLRAVDPRYVDCSAARGTNVIDTLYTSLDLHSMDEKCMHLLFTGYRGDGKTTELFRFINRIKGEHRPFYINAEEEFDLNDFTFPDFLLGIARAVFDRMDEQKLSLSDTLIREVAGWFSQVVETVDLKTSAEITAEAGAESPKLFKFVTAKLMGTIKAGGEKRKQVRTELNQNLTQLIDKVDKLLSEAVKVSQQSDNRKLVIIFDSLDRLRPELAYDLFHTNGQNLRELNSHFIYVVPISLLYQPESPLLPFDADNIIVMPMISVRNKENQPNEANIAHLTGLLKRRFVPNGIMTAPDEIMRAFILASGGNLRDLMRLFRQACRDALSEPDKKINPKIAQRAINELCETYQRAVAEEDYADLIQTYKNKTAENNERMQRLIYNNVILVYEENGVTWKDVHSALANGEKFLKLLLGS